MKLSYLYVYLEDVDAFNDLKIDYTTIVKHR